MPRYATSAGPAANHGIVGLASMPDGRTFFTTHEGWLHELQPRAGAATAVLDRGAFHPEGRAYASSLFVLDHGRVLAGVTQRNGGFEWVRRALPTGRSEATPIDLGSRKGVLL